jgi:hypothetical protein
MCSVEQEGKNQIEYFRKPGEIICTDGSKS